MFLTPALSVIAVSHAEHVLSDLARLYCIALVTEKRESREFALHYVRTDCTRSLGFLGCPDLCLQVFYAWALQGIAMKAAACALLTSYIRA